MYPSFRLPRSFYQNNCVNTIIKPILTGNKKHPFTVFVSFSTQHGTTLCRLYFTAFLSYLVRLCLTILHICLVSQGKTTKVKKTTKMMMKMTKFLQYLDSSGKFKKKLLCKVQRSIYQQFQFHHNFINFSLLFFIRIFCILLKLLHFPMIAM